MAMVDGYGASTIYSSLFPYGLGAVLAIAINYLVGKLPGKQLEFYSGSLAVVICGFVGFPLFAGELAASLYEVAVITIVGTILCVSWRLKSAKVLALAWLGHGVYDLCHLTSSTSPFNPSWVHQLCVPFDWLIASFIIKNSKRWS